jgi:hypothetical protein
VEFPATMLAISSKKIYRRYAISTIDGIDKDKNEEIIV